MNTKKLRKKNKCQILKIKNIEENKCLIKERILIKKLKSKKEIGSAKRITKSRNKWTVYSNSMKQPNYSTEIIFTQTESAISTKSISNSDAVLGILTAAKEAMDSENPAEALHIANAIPSHIDSLEASIEDAEVAIADAKLALNSAEGELRLANTERLEEAEKAFSEGDSALAKGLADSLAREVRETTDAMQSVQRALRQKKQIISEFPSGDAKQIWEERLLQVETEASTGEWKNASNSLDSLTKDLAEYQSEVEDANELLQFVQSEWKELRRRLDSSSISATDEFRIATESAVNDASKALDAGEIQDCLTFLGKADELLEGLRRRVV